MRKNARLVEKLLHDRSAVLSLVLGTLLGLAGCSEGKSIQDRVRCGSGGAGGIFNVGSAGFSGDGGGEDAATCVPGTGGEPGGPDHRPTPAFCPPMGVSEDLPVPATGLNDQCLKASDCKTKPFGVCTNESGGGGRSGNVCAYNCEKDTDCESNEVCFCRPTGNRGGCVSAACRQDSDCGSGRLCVFVQVGCNGYQYVCQTPGDQCETDSDCSAQGGHCVWNGQNLTCRQCPTP
jgi:hypothetical protein